MAKTPRFPGLGRRIRQKYDELGSWKTQVMFAVALKTSQPNVSRWMSDRDTIPGDVKDLKRIAKLLDADPCWLLFGDEHLAECACRHRGR